MEELLAPGIKLNSTVRRVCLVTARVMVRYATLGQHKPIKTTIVMSADIGIMFVGFN